MSQKIAYVTGGMGGIGTAICQRLAKDGFKVIAGCGQILRVKIAGLASKKPWVTTSLLLKVMFQTGKVRLLHSKR